MMVGGVRVGIAGGKVVTGVGGDGWRVAGVRVGGVTSRYAAA